MGETKKEYRRRIIETHGIGELYHRMIKGLSPRAQTKLAPQAIHLDELLRLDPDSLAGIVYVGRNQVSNLCRWLSNYRLSFGMPEDEVDQEILRRDYCGNERLKKLIEKHGREAVIETPFSKNLANERIIRTQLKVRGLNTTMDVLTVTRKQLKRKAIFSSLLRDLMLKLLPLNLNIEMSPEQATEALRLHGAR